MQIEVLRLATEITKEAVAHSPSQIGGEDQVAEFLETVARKLEKLYNEPPPPAKPTR
jgi:hypothetical protein